MIHAGLQMYSVRNALRAGLLKAIRSVAEMGYRYLEFANLDALEDFGCGFPIDGDALKCALEAGSARSVSSHFLPLDERNIGKVVDFHSRLGTEYLIAKLSEPYVDGEKALRLAETYNRMGKTLMKRNMRLCYYPRFFDYIYRFDGEHTLLQLVMEHTDPACVDLEIDLYWLYRWNIDPVTVMRAYGDRIKLMHIKDMPAGSAIDPAFFERASRSSDGLKQVIDEIYAYGALFFDAKYFTELGQGVMDLQKYIDAAIRYTKTAYIFLEQDYSQRGELESVKASMDCLKRLRGVSVV